MADTVAGRSDIAVGFCATAVCLLIALSVFPDDPSPKGALVLPASILAFGILLVPLSRAIRRSPTLLHAENLVAIGFVFWLLLDLVQGSYSLTDAPDWAIRDAFIAIGLSAIAMWAGVAFRPWQLPEWVTQIASSPLTDRAIARLVPACFLLGMFNFAYATNFDLPLMFSYLGQPRWSAPWGRAQLGGWDAFLDQLQYFGYVLPSLTALVIARRGFILQAWLSIAASGIMLAFMAQGGGRRLIGVTVGAAILVWVQAQEKIDVRKLTLAAVAVVGLLTIMQFMLNVRNLGYQEFEFRGESDYDYLHVDDNFLRLAQVIELVPAEYPYLQFGQVWFTIIRPIPRVLWPGKPVDPGFDLPTALGAKGVSLSMSIIGEWYISFGWLTVIFGGWLHGRLARSINALRDVEEFRSNPIVYGLAVMVLVAGMRSMLELVLMSYALIAWWGVNRLTRERVIPTR
jgi:oligosaccharide repeat unit polymerase